MSVVACRVCEDRVEIASDSITVLGYTQTKGQNVTHSKLWQSNEMTIGCVGLCEEGEQLCYFSKTHRPAGPQGDAVHDFFIEFSQWKKKLTEKHTLEGSYVLIYQNAAFYVNNFYVTEIATYEAIGAGMDFALAALYLGHDVEKAVGVACELSVYCEKPVKKFVIKK